MFRNGELLRQIKFTLNKDYFYARVYTGRGLV